MNKATHVIIHHTAVSSPNYQFNAVNNYHKSLDFPESSLGYYVGYHWFIERDGTKKRARTDTDTGAHTLNGWNTKSIGICLAGNFDVETPTEAQIASLRDLVDMYDLPYLLHREADTNRTCPGRYFSKDLLELENIDEVDQEKTKALQEIIDELNKKVTKLEKTIAFLNDFVVKNIIKYIIRK